MSVDDLSEAYYRISLDAERRQKDYADAAAKLGYVVKATRQMGDAYAKISGCDLRPDDRETLQLSGGTSANAIIAAMGPLHRVAPQDLFAVDHLMGITVTAATTADMSCSAYLPKPTNFYIDPCPYLPDAPQAEYAAKLEQLDRALANTYRAAHRLVDLDAVDGWRAALFELRQTYDHFFGILAPDDIVRRSPWFKPKEPPRPPDAVDRIERLLFAADSFVASEEQRDALVAAGQATIAAYKSLQQAHDRHELEPERARTAFLDVNRFIGQWISAIHPWPPVVGRSPSPPSEQE